MKLAPVDYRAPHSVDEALELLEQYGDEAKVLAGGQSLVPLLAMRLARPSVLIDVGRIASLAALDHDVGTVTFGATVRQRTAERSEVVRRHVPLMADALPQIGHLAIRGRGTIGGSLAHADPAAELPAVALACDAEVVVASAARGERTVPAEQFFVGFLTTAIDADELLTAVRVPDVAANTGTSFVEVTRRHGDFAIVGAATMVKIDGDRIVDVRIVLTGVTDTPLRCLAAESALCGASPSVEAFRAAAAAATDGLHPPSDLHGSASYRAHVARVVVRRALTNAASRSGASH